MIRLHPLNPYSVYKRALGDHVITNAAGGRTVTVKKSNFPDTGVCMCVHVHMCMSVFEFSLIVLVETKCERLFIGFVPNV